MFEIILGTLFGSLQINLMLTNIKFQNKNKKEKELYINYVFFAVSQASKHL